MDQRALKKDPDSVKKQQIAIDKKCHTHYLLAMKIQYSRDMLKKMKDEKTIARYYGKLAGRIVLSLSVLNVADCLEDVPNVPPTRRHKLEGEPNHWAIDLSANWRMIIEGLDGDEPSSISEIKIVRVEDYH